MTMTTKVSYLKESARVRALGAAAVCVLTLAAGAAGAMGERVSSPSTATGRDEVVPSAFQLSSAAQTSRPGPAEMTHAAETAQAGRMTLETSRVAMRKATNPALRQFAQFEVEEQAVVADILQKIYPNLPTPVLTSEEQALLTQLENMPAGAAFDRMYVQQQMTGHERLLRVHDNYLQRAAYLPQESVARLARGMVRQHISMLQAYSQATTR